MPFTPEEFEGFMTELNSKDTELERKTDILQNLRKDYSDILAERESTSRKMEELNKEREHLLTTNSKLFRSSSYFNSEPDHQEKVEQKTFSETVKLSDIEKRANI